MSLNLKQRLKSSILKINFLLYKYYLVDPDCGWNGFWPEEDVYQRNRITGGKKRLGSLSYMRKYFPELLNQL